MTPVRAHVLAEGRPGGPVVVLAHGLEDAWPSWRTLAAELDPRWRVIALDLPWRAGNDYGWRDRSAARWLADGLALLPEAPDAVVAHSFGANAAMELFCDPLLDVLPTWPTVLLCPFFRIPGSDLTWKTFDRSRAAFDQQMRDGLRARVGARSAALDPEVLETMAGLVLDRVGPQGFLTVFEQFVDSAALPLHRVVSPTLVLAGGVDSTLSPRAAAALAEAIPGCRLQVHDDYDHFCHIRRARGVAARITDHLALALAATGRQP